MTGYAIVVASDELERLQAVSIVSSIAAASDIPVSVFVTMNGLLPFTKEVAESGDFKHGEVGKAMLESEMEVPLFTEQLEQAKMIGDLEMYACTMAMDVMGHSLDDYVDLFDGELGVAGFLEKAQDKQVLFI